MSVPEFERIGDSFSLDTETHVNNKETDENTLEFPPDKATGRSVENDQPSTRSQYTSQEDDLDSNAVIDYYGDDRQHQETQTDWSWMQDIQTLAEKKRRLKLKAKEEQFSDDDSSVEAEKEEKKKEAERKLAEELELKKETSLALSEASSIPYPSRHDEYGIPLLEIDADEIDKYLDDMNADIIRPATSITIPNVGPPNILKYQKESELTEKHYPEPSADQRLSNAEQGGLFEGVCEFCGQNVKPFPSVVEQKMLAPEELYCCHEYQAFIQYLISHPIEEEHHKEESEKQISVKPHGPYKNKEARRLAKEKAEERLRLRAEKRSLPELSLSGGDEGSVKKIGSSGDVTAREGVKDKEGKETGRSGVKEGGLISGTARKEGGQISRHGGVGLYGSPSGGAIAAAPPTLTHFGRQMKTVNYQLSSLKCLEEGWTVKVPEASRQDEALEVFEPMHDDKIAEMQDPIIKYYDDKKKHMFLVYFRDGTGTVYYPSGQIAISIIHQAPMGLTYIVQDDNKDNLVVAVFDANGFGYSDFNNGQLRLQLNPMGGREHNKDGHQRRVWLWKEWRQKHVHAPPIQPITVSITTCIGLRVFSQHNITLTFVCKNRSARFHVGVKVKPPNSLPPITKPYDELYRKELESKIEMILCEIANHIRLPHSTRLDNIPPPGYAITKQEKLNKLREEKILSSRKQLPRVVVS